MNHFKSKGSACWEDAAPVEQGGQSCKDLDYQGACENFRVAAAVALGDALANIDGHKVILGDMNSYGLEDPMLVLTDYTPEKCCNTIRAARNFYIAGVEQFGDSGTEIKHSYGYLNAVAMKHPDSWSYSFNDEVGALNHLLVSQASNTKSWMRPIGTLKVQNRPCLTTTMSSKATCRNTRINSAPLILTQRYWSLTSTVVH